MDELRDLELGVRGIIDVFEEMEPFWVEMVISVDSYFLTLKVNF